MSDMRIAETIRDQIGRGSFYMMGARDLLGKEDGLQWKVGRNTKGVTHVEVTLEATDTYTVRFVRVGRAPKYEIREIASHSGVYFDQLRPIIETETGLYLTL